MNKTERDLYSEVHEAIERFAHIVRGVHDRFEKLYNDPFEDLELPYHDLIRRARKRFEGARLPHHDLIRRARDQLNSVHQKYINDQDKSLYNASRLLEVWAAVDIFEKQIQRDKERMISGGKRDIDPLLGEARFIMETFKQNPALYLEADSRVAPRARKAA